MLDRLGLSFDYCHARFAFKGQLSCKFTRLRLVVNVFVTSKHHHFRVAGALARGV
jgi:hypothetical protein